MITTKSLAMAILGLVIGAQGAGAEGFAPVSRQEVIPPLPAHRAPMAAELSGPAPVAQPSVPLRPLPAPLPTTPGTLRPPSSSLPPPSHLTSPRKQAVRQIGQDSYLFTPTPSPEAPGAHVEHLPEEKMKIKDITEDLQAKSPLTLPPQAQPPSLPPVPTPGAL